VLCGFSGRKWIERELQVAAGKQRLEIELERESKRPSTVRAVQGETEMSLPHGFWWGARVRSLDSPPGASCGITIGSIQVGNLSAMDAPWAEYFVDRCGRYEIVFPYSSGLAPLEPLRVDVTETGSASALVTIDFN